MADSLLGNVPQIASPDRIQPSGLQSDTFQGYEKPIQDDNMSRLASSLGYFNDKLQAYGISEARLANQKDARDKEAEKQAKLAAVERWETMKSTNAREVLIEKMRSGEVGAWSDPLAADVVSKDFGRWAALEVTQGIEADIAAQKIPLGDAKFNPATLVAERAEAASRNVASLPSSAGMHAFAAGIEHTRDNLQSQHDRKRGDAFIATSESLYVRNAKAVLQQALDAGLTGEALSDRLRSVNKELGPARDGGALGIPRDRMDALTLPIVKEAAKNPKWAKQAQSMLYADRVLEDGTHIGSIADNPKHRAEVEAVGETVQKTLIENFKTVEQAKFNQDALARFEAKNGTFGFLTDKTVTDDRDTGATVSLDEKKAKEFAAQEYLKRSRAANDGKADIAKEVATFVTNGVKHPEISAAIENGFSGVGGTAIKSAADVQPAQIKAIVEGAQAFHSVNDVNPTYTRDPKTGASVHAQAFYHLYDVLTRDMKQSPETAATNLAIAYGASKLPNDDHRLKRIGEDTHASVTAMKIAGSGIFGSDYFGPNIVNSYEIEQKVTEMALAIGRTQLVPAEEATKRALAIVQQGAIEINGNGVFGTSLQKEDRPHIQSVLTEAFTQHKDVLEAQGIKSASELTLVPINDGKVFAIVRTNPRSKLEIPNEPGGLSVKYDTISAVRAKVETVEKEKRRAKQVVSELEAGRKYKEQFGMGARGKLVNNAERAVSNAATSVSDAAGKAKEAIQSAVKGKGGDAAAVPGMGSGIASAGVKAGKALSKVGKFAYDIATDAK